MKNKIWLSLVLIFSIATSSAQQEYMAGSSTVSIEPDSTIFSIALSGYGYPAEGRFSLEWIATGSVPANVIAFTGFNGKFFAIDNDHNLWLGIPSGENISWKKTGAADGVKALAAMNGKIYAINDKGELLTREAFTENARWKKIGDATGITALTALDGKLYATTGKNELMKLDPLQPGKPWVNIGHAYNIISMTSQGKRLFTVDTGDTLWRTQAYSTTPRAVEIGRYNGLTFNIHIKQIAIVNNRLYAVSKDNKLYSGKHSTDGNLSATAFAIRHNKKTVVLVGVDLTGFSSSLTDEVKSIVSKERNIAKSGILINASHTHFAPSAQAYLAWQDFMEYPDSLYLNNILKRGLVRSIEEAIDAMTPADLYFGRGTTNIGKNRSAADPENPLDKTLDVLEAKNRDGKITGILFLAACHAVFDSDGKEGYTIGANFPGTTRDIIRAKEGTNAIFIQGCAGDINPRLVDHKQTGKELAEDVSKVMSEKMMQLTGDISYSFDTVNIPIQHTIPEAVDSNGHALDSGHITPWRMDTIRKFQTDNAPHFEDLYARRNEKWAGLMLGMIGKGTLPVKFPEYIQRIDIGSWKLVGLSREAVNEYGPAIRQIWPHDTVSVAGYCNDVGSYLPNKWHVTQHLYEGYGSFFWYGQSGIPPLNVFEIVIDKIKSFKP